MTSHFWSKTKSLCVQDDEDDSNWGRELVFSADSWQVEMAQWIGKVWAAEVAKDIEGWDAALQAVNGCHLLKWKLISLAVLFGGMKPKPNSSSWTIKVDVEVVMQDMMAEALEDVR